MPSADAASWARPSPTEPDLDFLQSELLRLLVFAQGSHHPDGGFGALDDDGRLIEGQPVQTWSSTRMTYSFALSQLLGHDGAAARVDHGLTALLPGGVLRDDVHGGWFTSTDDHMKAAYPHSFVVLAAAAGVVADRPGAAQLLDDVLAVVEQRFWDDDAGLVRESFSADWSVEEPYRGANANMHSVEAFLAAADALSLTDVARAAVWRQRASRIVTRIVDDVARSADWMLPEHFLPDGTVLRDYNTDDRAHAFRPYGVTPGHLFEWARLCLHLRAARAAAGEDVPDWLLTDAASLFDTASEIGWARDGQDGFVYTTDFDGIPVTRARMHWVVTEAVAAAAALYQVTGDPRYAEDHRRWWAFARGHLLDLERGSWHAELNTELRPTSGTWAGKPDVYHAIQATLMPRLPLTPMFALALRTVAH